MEPNTLQVDIVIGQRLREVRKACGLSQRQAAELAHLDPSALNKIEMGTQRLKAGELASLCKVYGCDPNDVLDGGEIEDLQLTRRDKLTMEITRELLKLDDDGRLWVRSIIDSWVKTHRER